VVAIQHGRAIFNLSASFHVHEPSVLDHQLPMPEAPDPETVPTFAERLEPFAEQLGEWYTRPRPLDTRYVGPVVQRSAARREPRQQVWFRADGRLPDDPLLHACVVAYASDMSLLDSVILPHAVSWDDPRFHGASLDHAMWFHRPFRADEWLLYDQESPSAAGARGLARGEIYTQSGALAVSVVQEGLVRMVEPGA
jgi:acyl-CoA thioesterase-2